MFNKIKFYKFYHINLSYKFMRDFLNFKSDRLFPENQIVQKNLKKTKKVVEDYKLHICLYRFLSMYF